MHLEVPPRQPSASDLMALSEWLPDVAFFMSEDGVIQHVGGGSDRITGHFREELIGRAIFDLVDEDDYAVVQDAISALLNQHSSTCFETRLTKKCGTTTNIQWSGKWLNEQQMIMALARDVSNFKPANRLSRGLFHASTPLAHYEKRVLDLLLTEASEKQIADKLGLTVSTTHSYVTGIFRKFKVRGRAGLMSLWINS